MSLRTVVLLSMSMAIVACATSPARPNMAYRLNQQGVTASAVSSGVNVDLSERDFLPGQALLSLQGRATMGSISGELMRADAAHYMVAITDGGAQPTASSQIRRASINQELLFIGLPPDRIIASADVVASDTVRVLDIRLPP